MIIQSSLALPEPQQINTVPVQLTGHLKRMVPELGAGCGKAVRLRESARRPEANPGEG